MWEGKGEERIVDSPKDFAGRAEYQKKLFSEYNHLLYEECHGCLYQLQRYYEFKCQNLGIKPLRKFQGEDMSDWAGMIPAHNPEMKSFPGCFRNCGYFQKKQGEDYSQKYEGLNTAFRRRNKGLLDSFNYVDGQNTLSDIYWAVQSELWTGDYPASPYYSLSFELLKSYFQAFKNAGIVELKNKKLDKG